MTQNQCEHIRPDGARCQAPLQTGKSFCFFHDPAQEKNRARARRNGGYMRGRYIDSGPDASPVALNLGPICAKTVDDLLEYMERAANRYDQGGIDDDNMATIIAECNFMLRSQIEKRRLRQEAARETCTKEAIARQVEAAVQQALAKAGFPSAGSAAWVEAPGSVGHGFSHDGARIAGEPRVKGSGDEQFRSAEGTRAAQQSAPKEEPIIIDASKPWDPRQFGGKKPRISCVVPVFTSMRTGKIIDVNEPNPLDPPEHMLRDEFRRKPVASTPAAPSAGTKGEPSDLGAEPRIVPQAAPLAGRVGAPAEKSRFSGTTEGQVGHGFSHDGAQRTEPFQRREREITEEEHLAAEGPRAAQSRFSGTNEGRVGHGFSHDGAQRTEPFQRRENMERENFLAAAGPRGVERSATDKTAEPEPKDAKPKKDPNNPYSITTLLPDPPRPFESKPRDPCTDPPETPPPPKPPAKPGWKLHPMIAYWGLH